MNKNLYRVVFNRSLGLFQVASELARRTTRGGGGQGLSQRADCVGVVRRLSMALWLALGQAVIVPPAMAQIVADPAAAGNQRPTVLEAGNGVPLVNIQTPNGAGVSHNVYNQFDVDGRGAILNNARRDAQSEMGGWVQGNPWLAGGTAQVILNEVNSNNPSLRRGYIEVAGDRAQVIVANPAGVTCDGCGFVNAPRATITTGTPVLSGGALHHYRVQGGTIEVSGNGLDTRGADHTDLIARAVQVNAGIWARELAVTTGTNVVSADHQQIDRVDPPGRAPAFALDVGALGGMYAQKIMLVGTEHGVGVRHAGTIGAQVGELVVTVDGRLELAGGTLHGPRVLIEAESLISRGGAIEQTGTQDLVVRAGSVHNHDGGRIGLAPRPVRGDGAAGIDGEVPSGEHFGPDPDAAGDRTRSPEGNAPTAVRPVGTPKAATPFAAGGLTIAGLLDNDGGRILAAGDIDLTALAGLNNDRGHVGVRRVSANGAFSNREGEFRVAADTRLHASQFDNDGGRMHLAGALSLAAESMSNRGGTFAYSGGDAVHLRMAGTLDNSAGGKIVSNASLNLVADRIQGATGTIATNRDLRLTGNVMDLSGATTQADAIRVDANQFAHVGGKLVASSAAALTLDVREALDNTGGAINTNGPLHLSAGALFNRDGTITAANKDGARIDVMGSVDNTNGSLSASGDIELSAGALNNQGGSVNAAGASTLTVNIAHVLDNGEQGVLASGGELTIDAQTLLNQNGSIVQDGDGVLTIRSGIMSGQDGLVSTPGTLVLTHDVIDLQGATTQARTISLDSNSFYHTAGKLVATGDEPLVIRARTTMDNTGGSVLANASLDIEAGALINRAGEIKSAGLGASRVVLVDAFDNAGGKLMSAGEMQVTAGDLANQGGAVLAGGASRLSVSVARSLNNSDKGVIATGGDMSISAAALINREGRIEHAGSGKLTLQATDALDNDGGFIATNGELSLRSKRLDSREGEIVAVGKKAALIDIGDVLDNTGGSLITEGDLRIEASSLINRKGRIDHGGEGTLAIEAGTIQGQEGTLVSAGRLEVSGKALDLTGATTQGRAIDIDADSLTLRSGRLISTGDEALRVRVDGALDNAGAVVNTQGALAINAGSLDNHDGEIQAAGIGQSTLIIGAAFDNTRGQLVTAGDTSIQASALKNLDGSILHAGKGTLRLAAGSIAGKAGTLASNGVLKIEGTSADLTDAVTQAETIHVDAGTLVHANGTMTATGADALVLNAIDSLDNSGGSMRTNGALVVSAGQLINQKGKLSSAGLAGTTVTVAGIFDNAAGDLLSAGDVEVSAAELINRGGKIVAAQSSAMRVAVDRSLDNAEAGLLASGGDMSISAATLINRAGRIEHSGTGTLVIASAAMDGRKGVVIGNGSIVLTAGAVDLSEAITQAKRIDLIADSLAHAGGKLIATGDELSTLRVSKDLNNNGAAIATKGPLSLMAGSLANRRGSISSEGAAGMQAVVSGMFDNSAGTLAAAGDIKLQAGTLNNRAGRLQHSGDGTFSIIATDIDGKAGMLVSNGSLSVVAKLADLSDAITEVNAARIEAGTLIHAGGTLVAVGAVPLWLQARERLDNTGGSIATNGPLAMRASSLINAGGEIAVAGQQDTSVVVDDVVDNTGGTLSSVGSLSLTSRDLINSKGTILAEGDSALSVTVIQSLDNRDGGSLSAGGDVAIQAASLKNAGGAIRHFGDGRLAVSAKAIEGESGTIAGDGLVVLNAETVDLSGAATQGKRVVVDAGKLINAGGTLVATGTGLLQIDARESLDNRQGTIAARGEMSLRAKGLDNTQGKLLLAGNTTITASSMNNVGGHIEHAGTGPIKLTVDSMDGASGVVASNGRLELSGRRIDLDGAITQADAISINTDTLSHAGGKLLATGTRPINVRAPGGLDNRKGSIVGNGALDMQGGHLFNQEGEIKATGKGASRVVVKGKIDNAGGQVWVAGDVVLNAGQLINEGGKVVAAGASALKMTVSGTLTNAAGGLMAAGGDVAIKAERLDNRNGEIQHAGEGQLSVTAKDVDGQRGSVISNGTLVLKADVLNIGNASTQAEKVIIDAGSLNHSQGKLIATGTDNLVLGVRGKLNNAAGTIAGNGGLDLRAGTLDNSKGRIEVSGDAGTNVDVAAVVDNSEGKLLSAGDIVLKAGELKNIAGVLRATDRSALEAKVAGLLDNSSGGEISGGGDMVLGAATLNNQSGVIQHAGKGELRLNVETLQGVSGTIASNGLLALTGGVLDLTGAATQADAIHIDGRALTHVGGRLAVLGTDAAVITVQEQMNNAGGDIATNGALDLNAGSLSNRGGEIRVAGTEATRVTVASHWDNAQGILVSGGALGISAASVNNQGGKVQSANTAALELRMSGHLDNQAGGVLAAAAAGRISAGSIDNRGGAMNAAGALEVYSVAGVDNRGGKTVGKDAVLVQAGAFDNRESGVLVSLDGNLNMAVAGRNDNAGGVIQASGDIDLASDGLGNASGTIIGAGIQIEAGNGGVNNAGGTIASTSRNLNLSGGPLVNDGGLLQSKASMHIDTRGNLLQNRDSGSLGGIIGGGSVMLISGALDNTKGALQSAANLDITSSGSVDNASGRISAVNVLTMKAARIINRDTLAAAGWLASGLEGASVVLEAAHIDNSVGLIAADQHVGIIGAGGASDLQNANGTITSGGTTHVGVNRVHHGRGTLVAGSDLVVTADYLSGDGRLLSQGDMSVTLLEAFTNDGEVTVNGRAAIGSAGHFTNRGIIQAGDLYVHGGNLDNTSSGQIKGTRTHVVTGGTLTNRGLIDGSTTRVDAGTLDNVGTGRLYGDHLAIQAGQVKNRDEGGSAAVIAARQRLAIGAWHVENREQALIFSAGSGADALNIGGSLDANNHATVRADEILNDSATIESMGDLAINARRLLNRNLHFKTEIVLVSGPSEEQFIDPEDMGERQIDVKDLTYVEYGKHNHYWEHKDTGEHFYKYKHVFVTRTIHESRAVSSSPALIRAAGSLTARGDEWVNDKSRIVVGGALQGDTGNLRNVGALGERRIHQHGHSHYTWTYNGDKRRKTGYHDTYEPADVVETIDLSVYPLVEHGGGSGTGFWVSDRQSDQTGGAAGRGAAAGATHKGIVEVKAAVDVVDDVGGVQGHAVSGAAKMAGTTGRRVGGTSEPVAISGQPVVAQHGSVDPAAGTDPSKMGHGVDSAIRSQNVAGQGEAESRPAVSVASADRPDAAKAHDLVSPGDTRGPGQIKPRQGERVGARGGAGVISQDTHKARKTSPIESVGTGFISQDIHKARKNPPIESVSTGFISKDIYTARETPSIVSADAGFISQDIHKARETPLIESAGAGFISQDIHKFRKAPPIESARVGFISKDIHKARKTTPIESAGARPAVIRTMDVVAEIPVNSLFRLRPGAGGHLVEVDPEFADHGKWLSSDYLLNQLRNDPTLLQKRLGDGFYEQMLVRDQVGQLTGRRFLGAHGDDEAQ